MANSKQKPVPEGTKRSPGKSKFSIPRKEAPPIDGSYLDRLFADYEQQTKAIEGSSVESAEVGTLPPPVVEEKKPETPKETAAISTPAEVSPPATPPPPVLPPVEEAGPQNVEEAATQGPPPEVPQSVETATVKEKPEERTPEPAPMPPGIDEELIQRLVKLHRLSKGEAGVLRVMIHLCQESESNTCYIKIPQLMAITGLKDRQTQRVLKSLSELQIIEKVAEYSNADRLGTKYRVIPFHD